MVTHPGLIGIWVLVAVLIWLLSKLVQLVEGAVLRAWIGRLSILIRTRGSSIIRLLIRMRRDGTFAVGIAVLHTIVVAIVRTVGGTIVRARVLLSRIPTVHLGRPRRFLDRILGKTIRRVSVVAAAWRRTWSLRRIATVWVKLEKPL